ncbi:MAG: LCP family protein [Faecousia sp.]
MGKSGKYLAKKPVTPKKKKKILPKILIALLVIVLICVGAGVWYFNYLMNLITRPDDVPVAPATTVEATEAPAETLEATVGTTSPQETWPEVISDEKITNIMLIGQAARPGEEALIADTMILCSINRETKTLTLTSLMRDLRLVWPEYTDVNGKVHTGNNRINMAYNMGYRWDNSFTGGMKLLESIVEYNFGVEVDHSVEINFDVFQEVLEMIGGVYVSLSQEEIDYLQKNYPASNTGKTLEPGVNRLSPYLALGYARMRKVGHGDFERTERQREVIESLLWSIKDMNIFEINKMFTTLLPSIKTDMTNSEMLNYAFEFIPMLKDLKIQSQRIPFDDTYWSISVEIEGQPVPDSQLQCNVEKNAQLLQESLGLTGRAIGEGTE